MDIGTIITILILVGSFIYSAFQNAKAYREQRPGEEERSPNQPSEWEEPDPFAADPFQPESTTKTDTAEGSTDQDGRKENFPGQEPVDLPETGGPYPRELLDRETGRTTEGTSPSEGQPYQRSETNSYERQSATPYKRASKQAYQRRQKRAYRRRKAARKQRAKMQRRVRQQQLKELDPVQAVMYSEIINRPKYLEDPSLSQRW